MTTYLVETNVAGPIQTLGMSYYFDSNTAELAAGMGLNVFEFYGLGRAAGNCPTELLLGFLKNPKFNIRPILDLISKEFIPLREKIEWGYVIPYAITGILDEHPRAALELRSGDHKENYREFYDSLAGSETVE